jgi:FlaA1/EpsC-like NDP-sugar epimerase
LRPIVPQTPLINQKVVELSPKQVIGLDNNESALFFLYEEQKKNPFVKLYTADLRDEREVESRIASCEIVLHAAAVKHVFLCEESPFAAIHTNILGTQNIIDAAMNAGVERLLLTSSDKAVNPTNVMGTSKLMAERLVTAANARARGNDQIFVSTRFGNVLGSRGSVIPLFLHQIRMGGPVTLTSSQMTRFIMTMEEAVNLVMDSLFLARGGEVFVTKMPVIRIRDLAEVMIEELAAEYGYRPSDIRIDVIGPRPGEKMYEELISEEEIQRSIELPKYFVIRPAILPTFRNMQ